MITVPDTIPLMSLPVWMPGSLRAYGAQNTKWYALWSSIGQSFLPVLNNVIDFSENNPSTWTGNNQAEEDFLSFWTPDLSVARKTKTGVETDAARLERLLLLRTLLVVPFPESERVLEWALTAALGLAVRRWMPVSAVPPNVFIPRLEASIIIAVTLSSSFAASKLLKSPESDTFLLASESFCQRPSADSASPSRYSPWGRAGAMPILDDSLYPKATGNTADFVKDIRGRKPISFTFPVRQYTHSVRPGLYDPQMPVEVLSSSAKVMIRTPVNAKMRGDADMRVPGNRLPSALWRETAPALFSPSWATGPRRNFDVIAPPFDLDTDLSQPYPDASPVYGTGIIPDGLSSDHPLAADYA